jgi:glycogen debranching enzyme
MAMLEAAAYTEYRLPEAFSGYDRAFGRRPVPYPTACNPQAWASGAPLLLLRTMLGLNAGNGTLSADPHLPEALGRVRVSNLAVGGTRWTVEAAGTHTYALNAG